MIIKFRKIRSYKETHCGFCMHFVSEKYAVYSCTKGHKDLIWSNEQDKKYCKDLNHRDDYFKKGKII